MSVGQIIVEVKQAIAREIADVVATGQWQHYEGANSIRLAKALASVVGHNSVQLASSGTAALEIALRAMGIGAKDEVLISGYDYPGNFWAIERVGARPVLVDTLAKSWRIDLESLEGAFQPSCEALITNHLHGELQEVDELKAWCESHGVVLIEDVCQVLGARRNGLPVGSFGDVAILSFGGGKQLSCGRGGALATSNEMLAIKSRVAAGAGSGPYELSELQATTVLAQLPWLDAINAACREFFEELDLCLKQNGCSWHFVSRSVVKSSAFYQCGWLLNEELSDTYRQRLLMVLQDTRSLPKRIDLPFGTGFPGFHRRSEKRCRAGGTLSGTTAAALHTIVLHHRVVLQSQFSPDQLANWVMSCIAKLGESQ